LTVSKLINGQLVRGDHDYQPDVGNDIQKELDLLKGNAMKLCSKISTLMTLTRKI